MKRRRGRMGFLLKYLVGGGNILWLNLSFVLLFHLFGTYLAKDILANGRYLLIILNLCAIPVMYHMGDSHADRLGKTDRLPIRAFSWTLLHMILFGACLILTKTEDLSRLFLFSYYLIFCIGLLLWWWLCQIVLNEFRRRGYNYIRVLILGLNASSLRLAHEMQQSQQSGYKIVGFLSNTETEDTHGMSYLGRISDLSEVLKSQEVDEVYCTLQNSVTEYIHVLIGQTEKQFSRFYLLPSYFEILNRKAQENYIGTIPVISVRREPLEGIINRILKRGFDIVVSLSVLLFIFPPVWLFVAIGIATRMPGSLFFKQKRTGINGKEFVCYKFRSMTVNRSAHTHQATKGDARITPFGAFLRKSSLDEFPQFYNVLIGNMSIVGPRPHMLKHTKDYSQIIDRYMVRHFVKPGITGWAQVNGYRGETKEVWQMEKRVELDVWYIENWTFMLDIVILFKTVHNAIRGEKNAY